MKANKITIFIFVLLISTFGIAQKYTKSDKSVVTKKWNDITFFSSKSFAENIADTPNLSMLKKELELGANLKAIEDEEMVTIFAMTNTGYEKLQGVQDSIYNTSVVANRVAILKYHIIAGRVDSHSLKKAAQRVNGLAYFSTLQGEKLGVKEEDNQWYLVDSKGNQSKILATDFYHKNGFFHIVDGYVLPTIE